MNSSTADAEKKKNLPFWLLIIIATTLVIAGSYLGLRYYQHALKGAQPSQFEQLARIELEALKERIIQQNDTIDTNWLRTLNPMVKHVEGRLLWSSALQQGVVEFINLPMLKNNQQYRLWVYDLEANNSKPITASVFKKIGFASRIFAQSFTPRVRVKKPLKFELVLEEGDVDGFLPLLLAQP